MADSSFVLKNNKKNCDDFALIGFNGGNCFGFYSSIIYVLNLFEEMVKKVIITLMDLNQYRFKYRIK
jgi:hypothetical protein